MYRLQTEQTRTKYPLYYRVANYFRNKRFKFFLKILDVKENSRILDVGGTFEFWEAIAELHNITVLNLSTTQSNQRIKSVAYSGGVFPFAHHEFDVVFSNSTIEHVGDFWDQQLFAKEIQRCGRSYFVQVPSYWFPYEPHAHIPFFQFMPAPMKIFMRHHFPKSEYAIEELLSIRLLTKTEIKLLFPSAKIVTERMCGIPKSYLIVFKPLV